MHLALSKAADFLSVPSNAIAVLAVLGLLLILLRRRSGVVVAAGALAALAVAALTPIGNILLTPLEQRFPAMRFPDQEIDGIIVLGGSYDAQSHSYQSPIIIDEAAGPMPIIVDLARRYPKARIVFSGGSDPSVAGPSEAAIVKQYFISFGVPADRISIEERSGTTEENARFTADLIHPPPSSRWLLLTSAYHMPRAIGTFRKAGFNVTAFPAGQRTHGSQELWWRATNAADNLRRVDVAVHEWLGLLDYRIAGYCDEWFAGP